MAYLLILILVLCISFVCSLSSGTYCFENGNFTTTSIYGQNRDLMLSRIPSNVASDGGFYMGTTGKGDNKVYALGLCRADSLSKDCSSCVSSLSENILDACPRSVEVYSWTGDPPCMLRYSNGNFFGNMLPYPQYQDSNDSKIASNMEGFNEIWVSLMNSLITKASSGSSKLKFAAGETNLSSVQRIYAAVQCTPDLSHTDCENCLQQGVMDFQNCCYGKQGSSIYKPSCFFRWDLYPFLKPSIYTSPPPQRSSSRPPATITQGRDQISTRKVVAIVASALVFLLLVFAVCYVVLRKNAKKRDNVVDEENGVIAIPNVGTLQYDLLAIKAATENFSDNNKIGQGGFGHVYKGTLPDGQKVAVKRLSKCSNQGAEEFKNEVILLAKIKHKNLIRLVGYCLQGEEKILIYEFLPNKSLDCVLFDPQEGGQLDWSTRYKIIVGTARGLLYLHEESRLQIIHRDLKASNILLDEDMNPKISDFGMARLFDVDQTQGNTRRIVGTYGYMPPEYAYRGHFSVKSDVFGFGVVILEIISGKKNGSIDESDYAESLVSIAWKHWRNGALTDLIDSSLGVPYTRREIIRCIHIGLLCVQEDPAKRPSMQTVFLMLSSFSVSLPLPHRPAFILRRMESDRSLPETDQSSDNFRSKSMLWSLNEVSMTDPGPR